MSARIDALRKENQLLEDQASIQEGIFEADNRRTRALNESLKILLISFTSKRELFE